MKNCFLPVIVAVVMALSSCGKEKLYADLSKLSGTGVIEIGPHNVSGKIGEVFSKYIYVTAPNGGRIEIFGTSGVSKDQMIYARDIMHQYLTCDGTVYKTRHKEIIANSMANKRSALVFWDTQEQYEANISKVSGAGYNVQDLYATESLGSGHRDASYEEILHLIHNYGIAPTLFEYQAKLQKANDDAITKGIWNPWGDDLPKADFDDEYFAAVMDCYLGLWEGQGGTMGGSYKPSSREEIKEQDPVAYQLIMDLFGDIQPI
ncbi:MAG: hypothetical protein N4A71_22800 [Carboxylicivirga sp.]|jgi:hypothetical protein|nr:hypothetical protein [Carboxylicivirga sp.]